MHILVIGSHADKIKSEEKKKCQQLVTNLCQQLLTNLARRAPFLRYHGFIQCDCRYSISDNLNRLRQKLNKICQSVRLFLAHEFDGHSNRLCALLMHHLKPNTTDSTITISELNHLITKAALEPFSCSDQSILLEACKQLSFNGHVLFLPHEKEEESVLILDNKILHDVHACLLRVKGIMTDNSGILEEGELKQALSDLLKTTMEPEVALKYLTFAQFCTRVTANQLINVPQDVSQADYYFFPNLVNDSIPADLVHPGDDGYTSLYTWSLKCINTHQFFTPRFLHTLFIQIIKCDEDSRDAEYRIWKRGILLVKDNGTRSIIEVTDQTTRVYLAIQGRKGCEASLVKQRSLLISLIRNLRQRSCPIVEVEEFLIPPQNSYPPLNDAAEIPIRKVARSVLKSSPTVPYKVCDGATPRDIPVSKLLLFDSFHMIPDQVLQEVFHKSQLDAFIPTVTLKRVHAALKESQLHGTVIGESGIGVAKSFPGHKLAKRFEDEDGHCTDKLPYKAVYRELSQYSLFTADNLSVSSVFFCTTCN